MSWCSDALKDEAISLFAGLLANPDVPLSQEWTDSLEHKLVQCVELKKNPFVCTLKTNSTGNGQQIGSIFSL